MLIFLITILFQADEDTIYNLRDFRLPDAGAMELKVGAGFSGSEGWYLKDDSAYYYRARSGYMGGSGSGSWSIRYSGEDKHLNTYVSGSAGSRINSYTSEEQIDTVDTDRASKDYSVYGRLRFKSHGGWYLKESPVFMGWDGDIDMYAESRYIDSYLYDEPFLRNDLNLYGDVFLGVGIGKLRGVSSVARAWDFLEELGVASRQNIEALAGILASRWAYELKHWRYEKYFYSDVEGVLVDIDAVPRLTPYQVMRLDELINNLTGWRPYGVRCFVGLGGRFSIFDSIPVYPGVRMYTFAGYPISRRWQTGAWIEGTSYYVDLDHLAYYGTCGSSIYYYLGERWRIGSSVALVTQLGRLSWEDEDFLWPDMWFTPFSLSYYLDDKLTINSSIDYRLDIISRGHYSRYHHDARVSFDLTWRLR